MDSNSCSKITTALFMTSVSNFGGLSPGFPLFVVLLRPKSVVHRTRQPLSSALSFFPLSPFFEGGWWLGSLRTHDVRVEYVPRGDEHELVVGRVDVLADLRRERLRGVPHDADALADAGVDEFLQTAVVLVRGRIDAGDEEDLRDV